MPSIETVVVIGVLGTLACLGWFGSWWHRRGHFAMFEETRKWQKRTKKARAERDKLEERLNALRPELEQLEIVIRKLEGTREIIVDIQRERDTWMNLYYSQATGHDNAQRWMMREAQALAQQVKQLGGEPRVDQVVQQVRADYQQEHGQHIADYKSGEAAGSHEKRVQKENERVAELDGDAKPE